MRILTLTVILGLPLMALGQRADEGNADYCADQREEDETRAGADQPAGKTCDGYKRTGTDKR